MIIIHSCQVSYNTLFKCFPPISIPILRHYHHSPFPPQAASGSHEAYYFAKEIPADIPSYKQPCKRGFHNAFSFLP